MATHAGELTRRPAVRIRGLHRGRLRRPASCLDDARPRHRAGRVRGAARPQRLRQVARCCGPSPASTTASPGSGELAVPDRVSRGLPGLPAAAVDAGARQRDPRPARGPTPGDRGTSSRAGRGRPRRPGTGLAARAVRRRAAARRPGPLAGARARSCCSPTSRSARSTRSPGSGCTACCASCASGTGRRCCWSPTTSTRRSSSPTGSWCWTTAIASTSPSTCRPRAPPRPRFQEYRDTLLALSGRAAAPTAWTARRVRPPRTLRDDTHARHLRPCKQLHLNAFLMTVGHHEAAWRLPESDPSAQHRHRALQGPRPDRRTRQARLAVPRRQPGAVERPRPPPGRHAGADRAAHRARRGDRAHRADRDRVDHLQRAVQPGPPVRLARPHLRRPRRLEHRHHRRRRRRPQLRPRRATRRTPSATSAPPSSSTSPPSSGTAGPTTRSSPTRTPASRATPTGSTRSTTAASTSGSTGRSTCRARRRATRCSCRPARRRTARSSPRATPRPSSPPSRRSRRRSAFYADLKSARRGARPRPRPHQDPARHRARHRRHRGRGARARGRARPADRARVRQAPARPDARASTPTT